MSFDIKPYGPGAETAIYLKVVAVIRHENLMGSLARYARPPRGRAGMRSKETILLDPVWSIYLAGYNGGWEISLNIFKNGARRGL